MQSSSMSIDTTDKALLNRIQSEFPLTPRPFAAVGQELGIGEQEVLRRIRRLKDAGLIRRIGGNFVPHKVGFVSTLCAARVPTDRIEGFTAVVNRYPGVTHNYQRDDGSYNIWFTFIAPSRRQISANLEAISRETGITDILDLPATRVFKIRAQFDVT